jgi:hypothetical protein
MMQAVLGRLSVRDRGLECGQRQARVDPPADGVANGPPRPRVHDQGDVDEAGDDGDVGQVGEAHLGRAIDGELASPIGKDRQVVVAVGRGDEPSTSQRVEAVLAHRPLQLLAVHDPACWRSAACIRRPP